MGGLVTGPNTEQSMADTPPSEVRVVALEYGRLDRRGVLRGSCKVSLCDCDEYGGGNTQMKCVICLHPPGQHKKLTRSVTSICDTAELPLDNLGISSTGNFDGKYSAAAMATLVTIKYLYSFCPPGVSCL